MHRLAALALLLLLPARAALAGVIPEALEQFRQDMRSLVTVDEPPQGLAFLGGLALLGALAASDTHLSAQGREHLPAFLDHFTAGGSSSAPTWVAVPLLLGGVVLSDNRTLVAGATLLEGNLLLDLAVNGSKRVFGRVRPNRPNAGEWRGGGDSFPSSHAAHAFFIAAVLDATIDRAAWRWVLYPLASGVALGRVRDGVHYPTDVVAGGLLGWWVGHRLSVAHHLVDRPEKVHLDLAPVPGGAMLVMRLAF